MKMKYLSIAGAILVCFFAGCSKELSYEKPGGSSPSDSTASNFTAVINGKPWAAVDSLQGATILGGFINIAGISSDNKVINITLNDTIAGTYHLSPTTTSVISYVDNGSSNTNAFTTNQGADSSQSGGTVVVSSVNTSNKTISGTFQCKVLRAQDNQQFNITQGVFTNIPYTTQLPPAPTTDTFNVTIAGTPWSAPSIIPNISSGSLEILGNSTDGSRSVGLYFPQNVVPGTYTLNYMTGTYLGIYIPAPGTTLLSDTTGTLTILQNNTTTRRVRGNFQFPAIDLTGTTPAVQLTQGFFSVGY
jgi:hypothetical protein